MENKFDIQRDTNRISLYLYDEEECDSVLGNKEELSEQIIAMVDEYKTELNLKQHRFDKFAEWWNDNVVPLIMQIDTSDDMAIWKWTQLVKQELSMWIRIGNMVDRMEIEWICSRRGFDSEQKETLIEGLKLVDLFCEKKEVVKQKNEDLNMVSVVGWDEQ